MLDRLRTPDEETLGFVVRRAVIGLAHGLGMPVVAEGVETKDQLAFLWRELGDEAQGFLIGRPKPIEHYADLICGTADGVRREQSKSG